eukprot:360056-Chlamydomonas_euryale.AAC.1
MQAGRPLLRQPGSIDDGARTQHHHHHVVPLLMPLEHGLPFAATLHVVRRAGTSDGGASTGAAAVGGAGSDGDASASARVAVSSPPTAPLSHLASPPLTAPRVDGAVLELFYVLGGEGVLTPAGGSGDGGRVVKAGDSLLAWAGTTCLSLPPAGGTAG